MNKFKRFIFFFLLFELFILFIFDFFLFGNRGNAEEGFYKVEISRIIYRINQGESYQNMDLNEYSHIVSIREFNVNDNSKYEYTVEQAGDKLLRFEYIKGEKKDVILTFNVLYGIIILITLGLLLYLKQKIIDPFVRMNEITTELAKGNLTVPVKQEKSKYFKDFLWGLDMLREKLEKDRQRELELVREKKMTVLSLSHDIKTPLSACELYVNALQKDLYKSEEEKSKALSGIESNIVKIKDYVGEIAETSREDFLALEVHNTDVYLNDVLEETKKYYSEKCSRLHIDFSVKNEENCIICGDRNKIVEVIQNIIENAIKYGDGKYISIESFDEENCRLISVLNSGCEISETEVSHLFESFYRGSNSRNVDGSGLGLYICKELMHQMDGDIFINTSDNTFKVTIVFQKP